MLLGCLVAARTCRLTVLVGPEPCIASGSKRKAIELSGESMGSLGIVLGQSGQHCFQARANMRRHGFSRAGRAPSLQCIDDFKVFREAAAMA